MNLFAAVVISTAVVIGLVGAALVIASTKLYRWEEDYFEMYGEDEEDDC